MESLERRSSGFATPGRTALDPDVRALIERLTDPSYVQPEEWPQRRSDAVRSYAAMRGPTPLPGIEEVRTEDDELVHEGREVAIRTYLPPRLRTGSTVVYLHGGGWTTGSVEQYDPEVRHLAALLGRRVVSVEYRLAPEHPFPAGLEDCASAIRSLHSSHPERPLSLAGDSAGGNLALATALMLRGEVDLEGLLLLYPVVGAGVRATGSYQDNAAGYLLTADDMRAFHRAYVGCEDAPFPELAAPGGADLVGLPPTVVATAGYDPLLDEGRELAARLVECGVPVGYLPNPGLVHGFQLMAPQVPAALTATVRAYRAFEALVDAC